VEWDSRNRTVRHEYKANFSRFVVPEMPLKHVTDKATMIAFDDWHAAEVDWQLHALIPQLSCLGRGFIH